MSNVMLKRKLVGKIEVPDGLVDITDPCYNKKVWCRMNDVKVVPGTYNCYAYYGETKYCGNRCWITQIVLADGPYDEIAEDKIHSGRSWRVVGEIGVDAGLAGFFNHKPDFNDEEWYALCNEMSSKDEFIRKFANGGQGFWTSSGLGDGVYTVYAIRDKGKIIALEIRF